MQVIVSTGKLGNDERIIPRNAREVTYVSTGGPWRSAVKAEPHAGHGCSACVCACVRVCLYVYTIVYAHALLLLTRMMMCARLSGYTATVC